MQDKCFQERKPPIKSFEDMQRIALSMTECPFISLLAEMLCLSVEPTLLKNAILQNLQKQQTYQIFVFLHLKLVDKLK